MKNHRDKFTCDFETTTNPNDCRVWAYGLCCLEDYEFSYGNNIDDLMTWCSHRTCTLYFHNLKFDGEFILTWLFRNGFTWTKDKKPKENQFKTLISDMGVFYSVEIQWKDNKTTIYDSLKIIPFSVSVISKTFGLEESKLSIDYEAYRAPGHILTKEEVDYLRGDVVIVAKALRQLLDQGLVKMTQGSNALSDYRKIVTPKNFERRFPPPSYDHDIRGSYRGGFTYLNPKYKGKNIGKGIVLDVNSLYPSVMYSQPLPYGEGIHFNGEYEQDEYYDLYIQMLRCQFKLKPGHIPTVQLKGYSSFAPNEYVQSSKGEDIVLCLTCVDLWLFLEHYDVYNLEYISGWKFQSTKGMFKEYIDKWMKVKVDSTLNGNKGMRTLAKLMLNALYGKFATNPNVRSKIPYLTVSGIRYKLDDPEQRRPLYIPVGTFITAWARYKTITSAQSVYDRFIYADTDSLHLIGTELPPNLEIDSTKLGAWDHEATFTRARFIRQKSYIEQIDGELHVTCAGMPHSCHNQVTWKNFKPGAVYHGKLQPEHVNGGIILKDVDFTIKV